MRNSKTRFSETVQNYNKYRPSYPQKLIEWIIAASMIKPEDTIVDIGCGTGISTRLFQGRGFKVLGIDPNKDMLEDARKKRGDISYQKGDAENSNLANNSANLIISAQAFHWFNIDNTMKEFKRILKPNGFCCAFWNVRKQNLLTRGYETIVKKYSGDYEKTTKVSATIESIKKNPATLFVKEEIFTNSQDLDLNGLIGRAYSTSYIVHGVKDHEGFKKELVKLFKDFQIEGKITFAYNVLAVLWRLN